MNLLHAIHMYGYLLAGITAFALSAYFEIYFFETMLESTLLGIASALAMETAKVSLIITGSYARYAGLRQKITLATLLKPLLASALIAVSLVASLMIISKSQDRPYLERVKAEDKQQLLSTFETEKAQLRERFQQEKEQQLEAIREQRDISLKNLEPLEKQYENALKLLSAESDNVVRGTVEGPKFHAKKMIADELHAKIDAERSAIMKTASDDGMFVAKTTGIALQKALETLDAKKTEQLAALEMHDYDADMRVYSDFMNAAAGIANLFLPPSEKSMPYLITIFAALLVSAILEIMIYLSFSVSTATHIASLKRKHEHAAQMGSFKEEPVIRHETGNMLGEEFRRRCDSA